MPDGAGGEWVELILGEFGMARYIGAQVQGDGTFALPHVLQHARQQQHYERHALRARRRVDPRLGPDVGGWRIP